MSDYNTFTDMDDAYRRARALRARYVRDFFAKLFRGKPRTDVTEGTLAAAH